MRKRQPEGANLSETCIQIVKDPAGDKKVTFRVKVGDMKTVAGKQPGRNERKYGRAANNDEKVRKGLIVYKMVDFGQSSFEL